jgi:hypothetical protein
MKHEMKWTTLWFAHQQAQWENRATKASVSQSMGHQAFAAKQVFLWSQFGKMAVQEFKGIVDIP